MPPARFLRAHIVRGLPFRLLPYRNGPIRVVEAEGVSFGLQFIEQQADAHVKGCLGGAVGAVSVSCPMEHGHASGF